MSASSKKVRERKWLEALIQHLGLGPTTIHETEEPDFLLEVDSVVIGIEVTELYLPSNPTAKLTDQAFENEVRWIVENARQLAITKRVPPQLLQLRLSRHVISKKNRENLSRLISEFVANHPASPGEVRTFERNEIPREIVNITLYGKHNEPHEWHAPHAGWVHREYIQGLQVAIDSKDKLLGKYRTRCGSAWLMAVASAENGSSFIGWSAELANHHFVSHFDRVFFFEGLTGLTHELQIVAK